MAGAVLHRVGADHLITAPRLPKAYSLGGNADPCPKLHPCLKVGEHGLSGFSSSSTPGFTH